MPIYREGGIAEDVLMNLKSRILVVSLAAVAAPTMSSASAATSKSDTAIVRASEISAGKRNYYYSYRRSDAPAFSHSAGYRGSADPSFGPDGRLYRVPEYLRGQCYVDLGYGRFASCSNR